MFYRRYVLVEYMSSGWYIFQYIVFYWKTCLTGGHVFLRVCVIVEHMIVVVMSFMQICVGRGHVW